MGKFACFAIIAHNLQTVEVGVSGDTEVESPTATNRQKVGGLHSAVKVTVKNLTNKEDQFHAVDTYKELYDLSNSSCRYYEGLSKTALSKTKYDEFLLCEEVFLNTTPVVVALCSIAVRRNEYGHRIWLYGAIPDDIDDVATAPRFKPTPKPLTEAPRVAPIPAPRKKVLANVAPAVVAPILNETMPPPSYQDVMEPKNGMEDYYGRRAQVAAFKAPTVEIIPSIRDLHIPVSTQPVVFKTHTARPTPTVLDKVGAFALNAASRIAEANSNLANAAVRKINGLKEAKNHAPQPKALPRPPSPFTDPLPPPLLSPPPSPPSVSDMEEYYGKKWPDPALTISPAWRRAMDAYYEKHQIN